MSFSSYSFSCNQNKPPLFIYIARDIKYLVGTAMRTKKAFTYK
uniref:Uncharacterized protein n=1 Tax=Anguilla anguilla TaxID=7936 RepID=A0A0E9T809_ANGAN